MWTVPSPPLLSPPLPSLPSPPLLPLPSPPSLPRAKFDQAGSSRLAEARERRPGDQRVDTLIKLGPAVWPKRASVAPPWRSASENEGSQPWSCECTAKQFFFEVELRELWFESGLMNGPVHDLKGKWSECHRVRNAKRPREGSNSRTVPYYYIDLTEITHSSTWSYSNLIFVNAHWKVTGNGKQGFFWETTFTKVQIIKQHFHDLTN